MIEWKKCYLEKQNEVIWCVYEDSVKYLQVIDIFRFGLWYVLYFFVYFVMVVLFLKIQRGEKKEF